MDQSQNRDYYPDRACSLLSDPALYINREPPDRFNQHV